MTEGFSDNTRRVATFKNVPYGYKNYNVNFEIDRTILTLTYQSYSLKTDQPLL